MTDLDGLSDLIWVAKGKNTIEVSLYVYIDSEASRIFAIERQSESRYLDIGLVEHKIESRWSIPNRAEMESYRKESATFHFQNGTIVVNEFALSDCVVSHHIEALLFDGTEVALERDSEQVLEPASMERLKSMHAGIYDSLYAKYCAEACIFTPT